MKTITCRFLKDGVEVAAVCGRFDCVPGEGPIAWTGDVSPYVRQYEAGVYRDVMSLKTHFAAQFEDAMRVMAQRCGLDIVVQKAGAWLVLEE